MYPFGMPHLAEVFLRMRQTWTVPPATRRTGITAACLGQDFSSLMFASFTIVATSAVRSTETGATECQSRFNSSSCQRTPRSTWSPQPEQGPSVLVADPCFLAFVKG